MSDMVIRNQNGNVIYDGPRSGLAGKKLYDADLRGVDLNGVYLCGVYLGGADLSDSYLCDAYLVGSYLGGACFRRASLAGADVSRSDFGGSDLSDADLRSANFADTNLSFASLRRATLSWQDRTLIAEVLWRAATTESQRMLASYVRMRRDWCWGNWETYEHPDRGWALDELARWVRPGDGAPEIVRRRTEESEDE